MKNLQKLVIKIFTRLLCFFVISIVVTQFGKTTTKQNKGYRTSHKRVTSIHNFGPKARFRQRLNTYTESRPPDPQDTLLFRSRPKVFSTGRRNPLGSLWEVSGSAHVTPHGRRSGSSRVLWSGPSGSQRFRREQDNRSYSLVPLR